MAHTLRIRSADPAHLRFSLREDSQWTKSFYANVSFQVTSSVPVFYLNTSNAFGETIERFWENVQTRSSPGQLVNRVRVSQTDNKIFFSSPRSLLEPFPNPSGSGIPQILRRGYGRNAQGTWGYYSNIGITEEGVVYYNRNITLNTPSFSWRTT